MICLSNLYNDLFSFEKNGICCKEKTLSVEKKLKFYFKISNFCYFFKFGPVSLCKKLVCGSILSLKLGCINLYNSFIFTLDELILFTVFDHSLRNEKEQGRLL